VSAQIAQSYELKLLYPVIQLARTTNDFTIMYWLHDGFYMLVNNNERAAYWIELLELAVETVANELEIPSFLDIEYVT
jgi:hypothetical protein